MTMSALEYDTLVTAAGVCRQVLSDLQPKLQGLKQIYDAEGGVKSTLTQDEMDEVAALSGLTKAQADDAIYALTAVMLPAIEAGYTAMAQMAARFRGTMPMMTPPPTF
jgi:hypothetical protein